VSPGDQQIAHAICLFESKSKHRADESSPGSGDQREKRQHQQAAVVLCRFAGRR
jgi:hypothetical protein